MVVDAGNQRPPERDSSNQSSSGASSSMRKISESSNKALEKVSNWMSNRFWKPSSSSTAHDSTYSPPPRASSAEYNSHSRSVSNMSEPWPVGQGHFYHHPNNEASTLPSSNSIKYYDHETGVHPSSPNGRGLQISLPGAAFNINDVETDAVIRTNTQSTTTHNSSNSTSRRGSNSNNHLEVPIGRMTHPVVPLMLNIPRSISEPNRNNHMANIRSNFGPGSDGSQLHSPASRNHSHYALSDDEVDMRSDHSSFIPRPVPAKNIVYLLYASPLIVSQDDQTPMLQLNIRDEVELVINSLQESGTLGVQVRVGLATAQNLCQVLASRCRFLHLSIHTQAGTADLVLEDGRGGGHAVRNDQLEQLLRTGSTGNLACVFINACESEAAGALFVEAGVPHVICCRGKVKDTSCRLFTKSFYMCLGSGRSLRQSWDSAREAVRLAPLDFVKNCAEDFVMFGQALSNTVTLTRLLTPDMSPGSPMPCHRSISLPSSSLNHHHNSNSARMQKMTFWEDGETTCATFDLLPPRAEHFVGRDRDMASVLSSFADTTRRAVLVFGPRGIGKSTFVREIGFYAALPGRMFSRMVVYTVVPDECDDWAEFLYECLEPFLESVLDGSHHAGRLSPAPPVVALVRDCSPTSEVGSDFGLSAVSVSPRPRAQSAYDRLLHTLNQLERMGRRCLLILDCEDGITIPEDLQKLIGDLLDGTGTLSILCACRESLYKGFGGKKIVHFDLAPLGFRQCGKIIPTSLLKLHDGNPLWRPCMYKKGDVTTLTETEALRWLSNGHKLMEYLGGNPAKIIKAADRVTPGLPSLFDLLATLQAEAAEAKRNPPPPVQRQLRKVRTKQSLQLLAPVPQMLNWSSNSSRSSRHSGVRSERSDHGEFDDSSQSTRARPRRPSDTPTIPEDEIQAINEATAAQSGEIILTQDKMLDESEDGQPPTQVHVGGREESTRDATHDSEDGHDYTITLSGF